MAGKPSAIMVREKPPHRDNTLSKPVCNEHGISRLPAKVEENLQFAQVAYKAAVNAQSEINAGLKATRHQQHQARVKHEIGEFQSVRASEFLLKAQARLCDAELTGRSTDDALRLLRDSCDSAEISACCLAQSAAGLLAEFECVRARYQCAIEQSDSARNCVVECADAVKRCQAQVTLFSGDSSNCEIFGSELQVGLFLPEQICLAR